MEKWKRDLNINPRLKFNIWSIIVRFKRRPKSYAEQVTLEGNLFWTTF